MPINADRMISYLEGLITVTGIFAGFCFTTITLLVFREEAKSLLVQSALFILILCLAMFYLSIEIYESRCVELTFSSPLPRRRRLILLANTMWAGGILLWVFSLSLLFFALDLTYLGWFSIAIVVVIGTILYRIVWRAVTRRIMRERVE